MKNNNILNMQANSENIGTNDIITENITDGWIKVSNLNVPRGNNRYLMIATVMDKNLMMGVYAMDCTNKSVKYYSVEEVVHGIKFSQKVREAKNEISRAFGDGMGFINLKVGKDDVLIPNKGAFHRYAEFNRKGKVTKNEDMLVIVCQDKGKFIVTNCYGELSKMRHSEAIEKAKNGLMANAKAVKVKSGEIKVVPISLSLTVPDYN